MKIATHGSAVRRLAAERGTITVGITSTGDDRATVLADAVAAHTAVVEQATGHAASGAAVRWSAESMLTSILWDWISPPGGGDAVRVRRFQAAARVVVEFSDLAALAAWSLTVAQVDGVTVDGVDWTLTTQRRDAVIDEVRTEAVRDAVARATTLATAAGLGEPRIEAIYEDGLRPHISGSGGGFPVAMRSAMKADMAGGGLELRPADIEVTVDLSADFEA